MVNGEGKNGNPRSLADVIAAAFASRKEAEAVLQSRFDVSMPEVPPGCTYKLGIIGTGKGDDSSIWKMFEYLAKHNSPVEHVYVLNRLTLDRPISESALLFRRYVNSLATRISWKAPTVTVCEGKNEEEGIRRMLALPLEEQPDLIAYAAEENPKWESANPDPILLAKQNVPVVLRYGQIVRKIREELRTKGSDIRSRFLFYTNPTDVCTLAFLKASGLPVSHAFGYNLPDSYRFRRAVFEVAQEAQLHPNLVIDQIEGFSLGYHSTDGVVKLLDTVRIDGKPLNLYPGWYITNIQTGKKPIDLLAEKVISPKMEYNIEGQVHDTTAFEHAERLAWLVEGLMLHHNHPHFPTPSLFYPEGIGADGLDHGVCASVAVDLRFSGNSSVPFSLIQHGRSDPVVLQKRKQLKTVITNIEGAIGEKLTGLEPSQLVQFPEQDTIPFHTRGPGVVPGAVVFPPRAVEVPKEEIDIGHSYIFAVCGRQHEALVYLDLSPIPVTIELPHSSFSCIPVSINSQTYVAIGQRYGAFVVPLSAFANGAQPNLRKESPARLEGVLLALPERDAGWLRSLAQTPEFVYGTTYFKKNDDDHEAVGIGLYRWKLSEFSPQSTLHPELVVAGPVTTVAARETDLFYSLDDTVHVLSGGMFKSQRIGNFSPSHVRITALLANNAYIAAANVEGAITLLNNRFHIVVQNKSLIHHKPITALEYVSHNGKDYIVAGSDNGYVIVLSIDDHRIFRHKIQTDGAPVYSIKSLGGEQPRLIFSCGNEILGCNFHRLITDPLINPRRKKEDLPTYAGLNPDRKAYSFAVIPA